MPIRSPLAIPVLAERAGGAVDALPEFGVRNVDRLAPLVLPVVDRGVGRPLHPPVDGRLDQVQGPADEPVGELHAVGGIEDFVVLLHPGHVEVVCDGRPDGGDIGLGFGPELVVVVEAVLVEELGDVRLRAVPRGRLPGDVVPARGHTQGLPSRRDKGRGGRGGRSRCSPRYHSLKIPNENASSWRPSPAVSSSRLSSTRWARGTPTNRPPSSTTGSTSKSCDPSRSPPDRVGNREDRSIRSRLVLPLDDVTEGRPAGL